MCCKVQRWCGVVYIIVFRGQLRGTPPFRMECDFLPISWSCFTFSVMKCESHYIYKTACTVITCSALLNYLNCITIMPKEPWGWWKQWAAAVSGKTPAGIICFSKFKPAIWFPNGRQQLNPMCGLWEFYMGFSCWGNFSTIVCFQTLLDVFKCLK